MNYPGINKKYQIAHEPVSHRNRGMDLEKLLNLSNEYYIEKDIAIIYKKPTPIGINKVNYSNSHVSIKDAYFETQSTLDYNGIYQGKYLDFDAKETLSKTAFALANIHEHQILHIRRIIHHHGYAFLIIKMNNQYFLLPGNKLLYFIDHENRKSIPYIYLLENALIIKEGYNPPLDYLKALDIIINKGEMIYEN